MLEKVLAKDYYYGNLVFVKLFFSEKRIILSGSGI